jgi:thiol-disulfide isomerase/thioredoxin
MQLAAVALALALAPLAATFSATIDLSRPKVGDAAPPLELESLEGQPLAQTRLVGQVTVVEFMASWSKPCHKALKDLAAVRAAHGDRVKVLVIDVGEDPETVRKFIAAHPLPEGAVLALDRTGGTARRWGQDGFPTTFLVDEGGVIRQIQRGWSAGHQARINKSLRSMTAKVTPSREPLTAPQPTPAGRTPAREVVNGVEVLRTW